MHLRPAAPSVDPDSPFRHDMIARDEFVAPLALSLGDAAGPAVVCVNGRSGDGKTTFVEMFDAHLRERDRAVVTLRAPQHCRGRHPARTFLAAARAALRSLLPPSNTLRPSLSFGDLLGCVARAVGEPLFVLVDELERCSPAVVVEMLDILRREFDVPGVIVVLAANHKELESRIRHHLGAGTDAAAMLAACIDVSLDLPPVRSNHLLPLAESALPEANSPDSPTLPCDALLRAAHRRWNLTPRDVGRIGLRVSAALDHAAPPDWFVPPSPDRDTYAAPLTAMAALHCADGALFDAMFRQPITAHAAALNILSAAPPDRDLEELVATLLTVALRDADTTETAFIHGCQAAGLTDPDRITQLHKALTDRQDNIGLDREQLNKLTRAFDLAA